MALTVPDEQRRAALLFLGYLGAPTTADMVRAVLAWLRQESGGRIYGNNPWNLHSWGGLPGQIGYRDVGPGDKNVAVFRSLEEGVKAAVNNLVRLKNAGYGYDVVIREAQSGDYQGFLYALCKSSWAASRYGCPTTNNLLTRFRELGGMVFGGGKTGEGVPVKPDKEGNCPAGYRYITGSGGPMCFPPGQGPIDPEQAARDAVAGIEAGVAGAIGQLGEDLTDIAVTVVVNGAVLAAIGWAGYRGLRLITDSAAAS